jgi:hypothetical protein
MPGSFLASRGGSLPESAEDSLVFCALPLERFLREGGDTHIHIIRETPLAK